MADHDSAEPLLNREQRRAARFHPKAGLPDPHAIGAEPDTLAGLEPGVDEAVAGGRDTDPTRMTSSGAGGATEHAEREPHTEASHFGNQPNS